MKKVSAAVIIAVLIITASCVSISLTSITDDLGTYNLINIPEEDLVTLYIDNYCHITQIDNNKLVKETIIFRKKFVKLNPGTHTLFIKFQSGNAISFSSLPVTAKLEKGNIYYLDYEIITEKRENKVKFHISLFNNGIKGEDVTGMPKENLIEMYLLYSANVEAPLKQGKSVKLENKKYTFVFNPDGVYSQTNKESGAIIKGKYWYDAEEKDIMFLTFGNDYTKKIYLFDAEANTTKKGRSWYGKLEDMVNSGAAHTILFSIYSTENIVIYQYEKPDELKGTEITFNITEVK